MGHLVCDYLTLLLKGKSKIQTICDEWKRLFQQDFIYRNRWWLGLAHRLVCWRWSRCRAESRAETSPPGPLVRPVRARLFCSLQCLRRGWRGKAAARAHRLSVLSRRRTCGLQNDGVQSGVTVSQWHRGFRSWESGPPRLFPLCSSSSWSVACSASPRLSFLLRLQMYKHSNNKAMTTGAIAAMLSTILYAHGVCRDSHVQLIFSLTNSFFILSLVLLVCLEVMNHWLKLLR